ncbi:MFS transporter [Thermanaerovibrio acidaminovorans]|uniref:Major facilitator superfamily MFS_1 n=1 Tax=Thermanaerovibrio acidaminovorans (strain ATCC 49978 / DSM 6589 / Su883) TaxID=525903 RepID=D1B8F6_THEAS|nr:MFS transporter [Thermanaerovibrio acidaminovorans]ACZ18559.1 major facilitator superfamily MFS_1 [Thermanaerovibrio acidaminovorans DSM 6589]
MERILRFLAINRSTGAALIMVIFMGLGEKMSERFLPVYLMALGGSYWSVGFLNGMDNLLSALYSLPGGMASHALGPKKSLILFSLVAVLGYLLVLTLGTWWSVLPGAALFISWSAVSLPAMMDLIGRSVPKTKRVMGVSMHSLVRRIPMALGPVIGGYLMTRMGNVEGIRAALVVAAAVGGISVWLMWRMVPGDAIGELEGVSVRSSLGLIRGDLRMLLVSDVLIRFAEQIPYPFVVLWALDRGVTPAQFGLLTALEMAVAMLVYIPVAAMADRHGKKPFVLMTFCFFTAFPLMLPFCRGFWPFAAAFVVRGLKEFGEPTRKALIMDLAPEGAKGAAFGAYYLLRDVVVSLAAFASPALFYISPQVNFLTAFAFGVLGTLWFALKGRDVASGGI